MEQILESSSLHGINDYALVDIILNLKETMPSKLKRKYLENLKVLLTKMNTIKHQIYNKTDAEFHHGPWTPKEHADFLGGLIEFGENWKKIKERVCTRTTTQLRSHARKCLCRYELIQDPNHKASKDEFMIEGFGYARYNQKSCQMDPILNKKLEDHKLKSKSMIDKFSGSISSSNELITLSGPRYNPELLINQKNKKILTSNETPNDRESLIRFKTDKVARADEFDELDFGFGEFENPFLEMENANIKKHFKENGLH